MSSIDENFKALTIYEQVSGAKVSVSKSDGLWVQKCGKYMSDPKLKSTQVSLKQLKG